MSRYEIRENDDGSNFEKAKADIDFYLTEALKIKQTFCVVFDSLYN